MTVAPNEVISLEDRVWVVLSDQENWVSMPKVTLPLAKGTSARHTQQRHTQSIACEWDAHTCVSNEKQGH